MNGDFIVSLAGENTKRGERNLSRVLGILDEKGFEYMQAGEHNFLFVVTNKPKYSVNQFAKLIDMDDGGKSEGAIVSISADVMKNARVNIYSRRKE